MTRSLPRLSAAHNEVLIRARTLIANPACWISWSEQGEDKNKHLGTFEAMDVHGKLVLGQDPRAVRFTTFGALHSYKYIDPIHDLPDYERMSEWMHAVARQLWNLPTAARIDKHEDALKLFDTLVSLNESYLR